MDEIDDQSLAKTLERACDTASRREYRTIHSVAGVDRCDAASRRLVPMTTHERLEAVDAKVEPRCECIAPSRPRVCVERKRCSRGLTVTGERLTSARGLGSSGLMVHPAWSPTGVVTPPCLSPRSRLLDGMNRSSVESSPADIRS